MVARNIQKMLLDKLKGDIQTEFSIELQPDIKDDEEKYLLTGTQAELRSQISLIMALRDLIVAKQDSFDSFEKFEQFIYENPTPLSIQIHWRLRPKPPFEPNELMQTYQQIRATPPRPYITMAVKREMVTWQNVKNAAGGSNGRMWGNHYAVARLRYDEGKLKVKAPQIKIFGASKQQARTDLKELLKLTPDNVYTMTGGEEYQDEGARLDDPGFRKPTTRVYPVWFYIINWELVDASRRQAGKNLSTTIGKMLRRSARIELHHDIEPAKERDKITNMLRKVDEVS